MIQAITILIPMNHASTVAQQEIISKGAKTQKYINHLYTTTEQLSNLSAINTWCFFLKTNKQIKPFCYLNTRRYKTTSIIYDYVLTKIMLVQNNQPTTCHYVMYIQLFYTIRGYSSQFLTKHFMLKYATEKQVHEIQLNRHGSIEQILPYERHTGTVLQATTTVKLHPIFN